MYIAMLFHKDSHARITQTSNMLHVEKSIDYWLFYLKCLLVCKTFFSTFFLYFSSWNSNTLLPFSPVCNWMLMVSTLVKIFSYLVKLFLYSIPFYLHESLERLALFLSALLTVIITLLYAKCIRCPTSMTIALHKLLTHDALMKSNGEHDKNVVETMNYCKISVNLHRLQSIYCYKYSIGLEVALAEHSLCVPLSVLILKEFSGHSSAAESEVTIVNARLLFQ